MKMVATKSSRVTDPVKPATLGKKFKADAKIKRLVGEKTKPSLGPKVPTKLSPNGLEMNGNHKVFNATLPPRWISTCAPSNFKFSKDLKSSSFVDTGPKHSTPVRNIKNKFSGGKILQAKSTRPSFDIESQNGRNSKHTSKPRLHTNPSAVLSKKLKSKELEINNLKHQLWLGDSHQVATESKSTVVDILQAYSLKTTGKSGIIEPVQDKTSNEMQRKLIQEVVRLKTDNDKKDEEKMLLQQELLEMNTKIENMQLEINLMKTDLKNKDIELLEALTDKNQEIFSLKQEKCQPEGEVKNQTFFNNEIQKHSLGAVISAESDDDTKKLEKLTAKFLGKVGDLCPQSSIKVRAASKDEKIKIQVKVAVRTDKANKMLNNSSFSKTFDDSPCMIPRSSRVDLIEEEGEDEELNVHHNSTFREAS